MNIKVNGRDIEVDDEGFLVNPDDWTDEVGRELIKLHEAAGHKKVTEAGWLLIKCVRNYYEDKLHHPSMNQLMRAYEDKSEENYAKESDFKKRLYELFPHGPIAMLAKLAGLPKNAVAQELED